MPYSFTTNFAMAEIIVNNNSMNDGLIVTYSKYYPYFDLNCISPYSIENEMLTYCSKLDYKYEQM